MGRVWEYPGNGLGNEVKIKGKCLGKSRPVKLHRAIIIMGENRLKVLKREGKGYGERMWGFAFLRIF